MNLRPAIDPHQVKRVAPGAHGEVGASRSKRPNFDMTASRQFAPWLAEQGLSLAFSTYQANMLFFIGLRQNGQIAFFRRACHAAWACVVAQRDTLYASSLYQIWRFENALPKGQLHPKRKGRGACGAPARNRGVNR